MKKFMRTVLGTLGIIAATTQMAGQDQQPDAFTNGNGNIFETHPSGIFNFSAAQRWPAMTFNNNSYLRGAIGAHVQVRGYQHQDVLEISLERSPKYQTTFASITAGVPLSQKFMRMTNMAKNEFRFALTPRLGLAVMQEPSETTPGDKSTMWGAVGGLDASLDVFPFRHNRRFGINAGLGVNGMIVGDDGQSDSILQTRTWAGITYRIG